MIEIKAWLSKRTGTIFDNPADCAKDENQIDLDKLKKLKELIDIGKPWVPEIGDYIYVNSHFYIDHGEDDVVGGLGQVTSIRPMMSGGDPNVLFVEVAQHPNDERNWSQFLVNEQAKLMREFGDEFAYPDPDLY